MGTKSIAPIQRPLDRFRLRDLIQRIINPDEIPFIKKFSQTLFGFTEAEAIGMATRYNKLEKEGLDPSGSKKSLHQLYLGRPMG